MTTSSPVSTPFADLGLPNSILDALSSLGYQNATPIQAETIPSLLAGRDVVGIAQTGTGKTAAFALPILSDIDLTLRKPQALILCPTRELSIQVADAFRSYAKNIPGLKVLTVCGGADMRGQLRSLKEGVHIVVATPGRLLDHLDRGTADFSRVTSVVLDEADEMLRMGFIDDVDAILAKTPKQRRVALFSATMPPRIRQIAERHLKDPVEVAVTAGATTNVNIEQHYWLAKGCSKIEALLRLMSFEDRDGVIVFTRTRESTSQVADHLTNAGYRAAALHGDMEQKARVRTVGQLKDGSLDILVATDVAARGLDVERITHVINFDIPFDEEAYVHRIGRTGRAGRTGKAILFVAPRERRMLRNIERVTQSRIPEMELPSRGAVARKRQQAFADSIREQLEHHEQPMIGELIKELGSTNGEDYRAIAVALASMLATERSLNLAPQNTEKSNAGAAKQSAGPYPSRDGGEDDGAQKRKNKRERRQPEKNSDNAELGRALPLKNHPEVAMERFRIAVGKRHGVEPREIVGAIANEAGIEGQYIGMINIEQDFSTVDLPEGMPKEILKHLKRTRVKGQNLEMTRVN